MQNISRFSLAIAAIMTLSGCGGGSGSEGDSGGTPVGDNGSNQAGDDSVAGQTMTAMEGDLKYDYSVREQDGVKSLYRTVLATNTGGDFAANEYLATNLYVGGVYGDDFYAPAIISTDGKLIRIASRIDGDTSTIPLPEAALTDNKLVCEIAATANNDGTAGVVAVGVSNWEGNEDNRCDNDLETWVYNYSNGTGSWWKANGEIESWNIFHNGAGDIDFVVANGISDNSAYIYSASGNLIEVIEADQASRRIEVLPLDAGGQSRDDGFVAVITQESVNVTSRRMLLESGLAGSSEVIADLDPDRLIVSRVNKFNNQGLILRSGTDLYLVDSVTRTGNKIADLTALSDDSWEVDEAFVHGDYVYVLMNKYEGNLESEFQQIGKLIAIDLNNVASGLEVVQNSSTMFRPARATNVLFFNYSTSLNVKKSIAIASNGTRSVSADHIHYVSGVNLEKGGKDVQTVLLKASETDQSGDLINPGIWTVNEFTGSALARVGNMPGDCEWASGHYGINEHVLMATMCDGQFAWYRLDSATGEIRYVNSGWQAIF